eukprot:scaffold30419_cov31-Tisochrysis_lutea.AAC.4
MGSLLVMLADVQLAQSCFSRVGNPGMRCRIPIWPRPLLWILCLHPNQTLSKSNNLSPHRVRGAAALALVLSPRASTSPGAFDPTSAQFHLHVDQRKYCACPAPVVDLGDCYEHRHHLGSSHCPSLPAAKVSAAYLAGCANPDGI